MRYTHTSFICHSTVILLSYIGILATYCPARHTAEILPDGTVKVTFYAHHNHSVQQEYAARFVDPLLDDTVRHMVDCKLLAGVTDSGKIAEDIRAELMFDKKGPLPFEELRVFHLCNALDNKHVINRRNQLSLNKCVLLGNDNFGVIFVYATRNFTYL